MPGTVLIVFGAVSAARAIDSGAMAAASMNAVTAIGNAVPSFISLPPLDAGLLAERLTLGRSKNPRRKMAEIRFSRSRGVFFLLLQRPKDIFRLDWQVVNPDSDGVSHRIANRSRCRRQAGLAQPPRA